MTYIATEELSERQKNEIEYHRAHALEHARVLEMPLDWLVLQNPSARWWNAYWQMYAEVIAHDLAGKRVLVVGCGFGDDALRVAKLGANVSAFDLSPESLEIAAALARRENLVVEFSQMPAESLGYDSDSFDVVIARDILHHVDIPLAMQEIQRVAKPGAVLVLNEIYSHSITELVRRSGPVERLLYPAMQKYIYGGRKPYITKDERKLSESDIRQITSKLRRISSTKYFNFLVTRLFPDRYDALAKVDRILLAMVGPFGRYLAGRILLSGTFRE